MTHVFYEIKFFGRMVFFPITVKIRIVWASGRYIILKIDYNIIYFIEIWVNTSYIITCWRYLHNIAHYTTAYM